MKRILIIMLVIGFTACKKDEYSSIKQSADISEITDIILSPNSPVLIGDGNSELIFKVKAFTNVKDTRKIEVKKGDEIIVKDSTFVKRLEINNDMIAAKDIAIYKEDGTKIDYVFTTKDNVGEEVGFYAEYKGVKSKVRKVKIIAKPDDHFTPIVVPVIFHILRTENDIYYYEKITPEYLQKKLDRLNRVFAGKEYPNAPSKVDTKISFELATHDTYGKLLAMKGLDIIELYEGTSALDYLNDYQSEVIWDLNKYLNIYIHGDADTYSYEVRPPKYILDNGSDLEMNKWSELQKVKTAEEAEYYSHREIGIQIHQKLLYQMDDLAFSGEYRFETYFGIFYGLLVTGYMPPWSGVKDDYCSDTYTYFTVYNRPEKWTFEPDGNPDKDMKTGNEIYYDSFNIMDDRTRSTTITYEQALRIRTVIENCPFRMMKK